MKIVNCIICGTLLVDLCYPLLSRFEPLSFHTSGTSRKGQNFQIFSEKIVIAYFSSDYHTTMASATNVVVSEVRSELVDYELVDYEFAQPSPLS